MIDKLNEYQSVCLVAPNRMITNMTNFDLIWPVTPKLGGRSNFEIVFFLAKMCTTRLFSTRKTRWCQNRCCRTNNSDVIIEKRKVWKIMLDPNTFWPLAPKPLAWRRIWELTPDSPFHFASSAFCGLKLSVFVWVLGQLRRCLTLLSKNGENFAFMTSFDLENVYSRSRSQNLHQKEFLCEPTHSPSLLFLAPLPAERAGGGALYAPHLQDA